MNDTPEIICSRCGSALDFENEQHYCNDSPCIATEIPMSDTPIADAFREMYPFSYEDDKAVWTLSARACLAQIKPFFDQYQFLRDKTEQGSLEETAALIRLDEVYNDVVVPLLRELGIT